MRSYLLILSILAFGAAGRAAAQDAGPGKASPDAGSGPAVHTVPLGSEGNRLELTLANTTGTTLKDLSVDMDPIPEWITVEHERVKIAELPAGAEAAVTVRFDLSGQAPAGDTAAVRLVASGGPGFSWSKVLRLKVGPPASFELLPNYPNPFNPSTTIKYQLPEQMEVTVSVYNILGRRVATLVDETQPAGAHKVRFQASSLASGLYFSRVVAESSDGKQVVENRKMMLIK